MIETKSIFWWPVYIVNFDSIINIQDIIILINFIIGNDIPDEEELHSGDINFDGIIDILDIVQIINIIFN